MLDVLPAASVATQFTVVTPSGKHEPEGGVQTTVGVPQLSVAEGLAKVTVVQLPEVIRPIPIIGAQEICGGSVSLTVTVNEQLPVFDDESVAMQVTVVTPLGKVEPDAGAQTGVRLPSQLSAAVAVKLTTAEQSPPAVPVVMGDGQVTTGASSSLTVTVNEQLPVLPDESVAMQVTVVTPLGKVEPDAGAQTGVRLPSQLSVALALKTTTAEQAMLEVPVVMGDGQVTTGASVSLTVTVNEQLLVLPDVSVAVQVTVVVPTGKNAPDEGEQFTLVTAQLSEAIGEG